MTPEQATPKLEFLQETARHNEVRVRALKHEMAACSLEIARLAASGYQGAMQALRADLEALREELAAAETPLATVRSPAARREAGEGGAA